MNKNSYILALATIVGTTVGAGIFGIPYTISKAGLVPGFFYFVALAFIVLLLHLLFGEIVLRTSQPHRLIGYAKIYFGRLGEILITISTVVGITGTLLAYIILIGNFSHTIFKYFWKLPSFYWSIIFWFILSIFVFGGIRFIAPLELAMNFIFVGIILFIFFAAIPKLNFQGLSLLNLSDIFSSYGILFFAFAGWLAIPEASAILSSGNQRNTLKKAIIWSAVLVFILYIVFTLSVLGVSGGNVSEDALSGLVPYLGYKVVVLGAIFGAVAVAASFLVLGNYFKNALRYDHKLPYVIAAGLATGLPLFLFLIGFRDFIETISLVGAVMGTLEGIVIILMFKRAKKMGDRQPEYSLRVPRVVLYLLIGLFCLGAISYFIK